jgi:hypothetical protein
MSALRQRARHPPATESLGRAEQRFAWFARARAHNETRCNEPPDRWHFHVSVEGVNRPKHKAGLPRVRRDEFGMNKVGSKEIRPRATKPAPVPNISRASRNTSAANGSVSTEVAIRTRNSIVFASLWKMKSFPPFTSWGLYERSSKGGILRVLFRSGRAARNLTSGGCSE